MIGAKTE
jgi:hypothetical protein